MSRLEVVYKEGEGRNEDGFGFVDVIGDEWKGFINLFWKDFPLALLPPPMAGEVRESLVNQHRAKASAVSSPIPNEASENLAKALRSADWSGMSIGNKALIALAAKMLAGENDTPDQAS